MNPKFLVFEMAKKFKFFASEILTLFLNLFTLSHGQNVMWYSLKTSSWNHLAECTVQGIHRGLHIQLLFTPNGY